ncbi:MAG: radical SAM protein [Deltaproteobacteria bacterium]|nr:radical SAM protein [Deltaproteobacteria bacterium]
MPDMDDLKPYENCRLCPRACGVNRLQEGKRGRSGFCGESHLLRVAYVGPHFGEEPPITGTRGSGTVFFTGCSLRCSYCQNYQISREGLGETLTPEELFERVSAMIRRHRVHNLNLVTPDHFFPHAFRLVHLLRRSGNDLPVVYNLSGYQSLAALKQAEEWADIYLPDFKYADTAVAKRLSMCPDYPRIALEAIVEMVRQKGFLDSIEGDSPLARKGVLVRHLILPGRVGNSLDALSTLFLEFGSQLPLSLMSQYTPACSLEDEDLHRAVTEEEFRRVYEHALDLGLENLFVQFPEQHREDPSPKRPFLPDFRRRPPFAGGVQD